MLNAVFFATSYCFTSHVPRHLIKPYEIQKHQIIYMVFTNTCRYHNSRRSFVRILFTLHVMSVHGQDNRLPTPHSHILSLVMYHPPQVQGGTILRAYVFTTSTNRGPFIERTLSESWPNERI